MDHVEELDQILREWTATMDRKEIVKLLTDNRIPCAPVLTIYEVRDHPQLKERNMFYDKFDKSRFPEIEKGAVPNVILRFSEAPGEVYCTAPELGEHNEEIYKGMLGFSDERLAELKSKNII